MRIGSNYNLFVMNRNIMQNRVEYSKSLVPISTGKRINNLSDDSSRTAEYFKINNELVRLDQYKININTARTRVSVTDSTLAEMTELMQEVYEIAIQGNDQTLTSDNLTALTDRLTDIKTDLTDLANTKLGSYYLFSGYKSTTKPFSGTPVAYNGDNNQVSYKVTSTKSVTVSVDLEDLMVKDTTAYDAGPPINYNIESDDGVFTTIDNLIKAIGAQDDTEVGQILDVIQNRLNNFSQKRAEMANADKALTTAEDSIDNLIVQRSERISDVFDVDLATATTEMTFREFTLQSAISVSARVMNIQLQSFFN